MDHLQQEVLAIFQSYDPNNFDPSECLQKCTAFLENSCRVGGEYDPRFIKMAETACNAYGFASGLFLQNQFSSAAISILSEAWNRFSLIQRSERQHIYRAGLGMYLTRVYLNLGDRGSAMRWALLTQAGDLLGEHGAGGGAGKQTLHAILGMSEKALGDFPQIAKQNLGLIRDKYANDWSVPYGFPEDIVSRFAVNKPEYSDLYAMPSNVSEFPLNRAYFDSLIDKAKDATSNKEKGDALEDVATYVFILIPCLAPRRNLLEETLAFETDLVVRNLATSQNVVADLLGRYFLVECKNWSQSVGVQDIGYFLYRMRLTHARFGVIFAKKGITGSQEQEGAAYSLIRKSFHEDGNTCVVIDYASLRRLGDEGMSFWSMLLELRERMQFGRTR